jgi:hypothetical protein
MPKALYLKNFMEHFNFTRRVTIAMPLFLGTNKAKITHKTLNLQHFRHSRYDLTAFFRLNHCPKELK